MQIHLSPRHITLTAAIHGYVAEKIGHLEEYSDRILAAHVVLFYDEKRNPKQSYVVKVHLAIPGPDIHADESDADLYAAIDKVVDKLTVQLRKRKTKLVDRRKGVAQREKEADKNGTRRRRAAVA